jgi:hypothetical protein
MGCGSLGGGTKGEQQAASAVVNGDEGALTARRGDAEDRPPPPPHTHTHSQTQALACAKNAENLAGAFLAPGAPSVEWLLMTWMTSLKMMDKAFWASRGDAKSGA